jgi:hypothetical protein
VLARRNPPGRCAEEVQLLQGAVRVQ